MRYVKKLFALEIRITFCRGVAGQGLAAAWWGQTPGKAVLAALALAAGGWGSC